MGEISIRPKVKGPGRVVFPNEVALRAFSICASEVETLGIRGIKKRTKTEFRRFMFQNHPDHRIPRLKRGRREGGYSFKTATWMSGSGHHISFWFRKYQEIMGLKYLPVTPFNFEKVFEAQKGFKTTDDIDFGLNGPDDYGKTTEILSGQVHPVF